MATADLTAQRLRDQFHYDAQTGKLWKLVGHETGHGYQRVSVGRGKFIQAHRLAWFLTHNEWPAGLIDHINGDRSDNRICNLRHVTNEINQQNKRKAYKNSKSGLLGASWNKSMGRWTARIHFRGKHHFLGYFDTAEEAHAAYLDAKRKNHPGSVI